MLKALERRSIVRTAHRSWPDEFDMKKRYHACVTIDPQRVVDAWGVLSEDTFPLEIATYPALLHRAFKKELTKRSRDE